MTPEQAAALDSGDMLRVGVFVTDDMRFIEETARAARLDRVQLHGDQSMTCANRLSRTLGAERLIREMCIRDRDYRMFAQVAKRQLAEHLLGGDAFLHGRGGNPRQNIAGAQFPRLIQHVPH